jgi:adenylate cyclase
MIELAFIQNIAMMNDSGFFHYWDETMNPWEHYLAAEEIRQSAFDNNEAASPEWIQARKGFFQSSGKFFKGLYEEYILADVGDDPEIAEFVRDLFSVSRDQFNRMDEIRNGTAILHDSFVVIGSDATSMTDNGLITFQEHYPNVGSYAVIANMLLSGEFLNDAPWFISAIIALLYALLIGFFVSRLETHISIITGMSGILLLCTSFVVFFVLTKTYIGIAVPLAATSLVFISLMVTKFLTASHEKAFLHNAFSRYLAPDVITDIINNPDKLNLGGEKREMTAIFTDIRGFSTISEQLDPTQLVKLLNRYLTAMSNIIRRRRNHRILWCAGIPCRSSRSCLPQCACDESSRDRT